MNATGAAEYHGPLTTWDIITLMSQDSTMLPVTLGNADLGNALPYFYREADSNAGHGQTFDNSGIAGNVQTEGRIVSINARTQVSLLDATAQNCNNNYRQTGSISALEAKTAVSGESANWILPTGRILPIRLI